MTTATKKKSRSAATAAPVRGRRERLASAARRAAGLVTRAGSTALAIVGRVPRTVRATRTGAQDTASALQTLPDSTLRWMAASSVGLGAGFYFARAPRLVVAAGVVPALIAGAAIALRPIETSPPIADAPSDPATG